MNVLRRLEDLPSQRTVRKIVIEIDEAYLTIFDITAQDLYVYPATQGFSP